MGRFQTVDDYVDAQPVEVRQVLQRVRAALRKALPKAEEVISYSIPAYRLNGRVVIYFAAWKKHWSLYPVTPPVRKQLGDALDGYEVSKGTVRFPLTEVKVGLIQKIAKLLARQIAKP